MTSEWWGWYFNDYLRSQYWREFSRQTRVERSFCEYEIDDAVCGVTQNDLLSWGGQQVVRKRNGQWVEEWSTSLEVHHWFYEHLQDYEFGREEFYPEATSVLCPRCHCHATHGLWPEQIMADMG